MLSKYNLKLKKTCDNEAEPNKQHLNFFKYSTKCTKIYCIEVINIRDGEACSSRLQHVMIAGVPGSFEKEHLMPMQLQLVKIENL